jgi:hypothetical protein
MVSEDSQDFGWLTAVHRLGDLSDLNQTGDREVLALLHETNHLDELLEVVTLRSPQLMFLKERDNGIPQVCKPPDVVPEEILPVVVVATIYVNLAAPEESGKTFQNILARG